MESHEKHEQVLNGKMEYFRSKMDKLSEKVSTIKEQRVQREEEFIHGLVDKVKEKERRNQELDKKREQLNKERMKALKEKNEKFSGNTHKLKQQEFARVNELQERKMQAGKRVEERKVPSLSVIALYLSPETRPREHQAQTRTTKTEDARHSGEPRAEEENDGAILLSIILPTSFLMYRSTSRRRFWRRSD